MPLVRGPHLPDQLLHHAPGHELSIGRFMKDIKDKSGLGVAPEPAEGDAEFWHSLINEQDAADFLGFSVRHMQGLRYRGGGSRYLALSSRCVRYRRIDLRDWAEAHLRTSTSDPGSEAA